MSDPEGDGHPRRALARLSSGVLLANGIAAIVLLATAVLTARALGPAGRGELSLATQFLVLTATLGSLSVSAAATYYAARGTWRKEVAFGNATLVGLLLGLGVVVVCGCVIVVGDFTFRGIPESDLLLVLLAVPFLLAVANIQSVYQGLRSFRSYNGITLAQAMLPLLLIGIAIGLGGGVRAAIAAVVAASVLLFIAVLAYAQRATRFTWRLKRRYVRALGSYGLRVYPANVLGYLGYRLDVFLVAGYKGAAAVGLYGAGVVIAEGLWMPSLAVSTALFPTIAAEQTESTRRSITPFVARNTLWLTAILGAILVIAATPVVVILYSSRFSASADVVRILVPGIVLFAAARVLGNDIAGRGRPLVNSVIAAASVVSNIALNVVLIPRYGINGAACASTASYSVLFVATVAIYRRVAEGSLRSLLVPSREDAHAYLRLARRTFPSHERRAAVDTSDQR